MKTWSRTQTFGDFICSKHHCSIYQKTEPREAGQFDLHSPHTQFLFKEKTLTFPGQTLCSKCLDMCLQKNSDKLAQTLCQPHTGKDGLHISL